MEGVQNNFHEHPSFSASHYDHDVIRNYSTSNSNLKKPGDFTTWQRSPTSHALLPGLVPSKPVFYCDFERRRGASRVLKWMKVLSTGLTSKAFSNNLGLCCRRFQQSSKIPWFYLRKPTVFDKTNKFSDPSFRFQLLWCPKLGRRASSHAAGTLCTEWWCRSRSQRPIERARNSDGIDVFWGVPFGQTSPYLTCVFCSSKQQKCWLEKTPNIKIRGRAAHPGTPIPATLVFRGGLQQEKLQPFWPLETAMFVNQWVFGCFLLSVLETSYSKFGTCFVDTTCRLPKTPTVFFWGYQNPDGQNPDRFLTPSWGAAPLPVWILWPASQPETGGFFNRGIPLVGG